MDSVTFGQNMAISSLYAKLIGSLEYFSVRTLSITCSPNVLCLHLEQQYTKASIMVHIKGMIA